MCISISTDSLGSWQRYSASYYSHAALPRLNLFWPRQIVNGQKDITASSGFSISCSSLLESEAFKDWSYGSVFTCVLSRSLKWHCSTQEDLPTMSLSMTAFITGFPGCITISGARSTNRHHRVTFSPYRLHETAARESIMKIHLPYL